MKRVGGVRVVVLMKRVAIGRTAGGVEQAVGIRCRQEWYRAQDEQGTAGGDHRSESTSRWGQGGAGGGAGDLGGVDRTDSGGYRMEEASQGTMEGKGTSSGEMGVGQE